MAQLYKGNHIDAKSFSCKLVNSYRCAISESQTGTIQANIDPCKIKLINVHCFWSWIRKWHPGDMEIRKRLISQKRSISPVCDFKTAHRKIMILCMFTEMNKMKKLPVCVFEIAHREKDLLSSNRGGLYCLRGYMVRLRNCGFLKEFRECLCLPRRLIGRIRIVQCCTGSLGDRCWSLRTGTL